MKLFTSKKAFLMVGIAIVMASLIMSGCSSVQRMSTKMGINMGAPVVSLMIDVLKDTKSGKLAEKGFAGQLLMLTGMVELAPNNFRLLNDTSFLYCAYGIFMEDKEPQFAKELYDIGYEYGMRALKQNRKFRIGIEEGKKLTELVPHLGKKYVPSLVWTALNKGLWIVLNMDDPEALMGMADTIALIKRSIELDENFYFGAGKMFLGAYYAMIPEYLGLGGGPENSEKMFKEAREATNGKFLLVSVLEARYLATTIDDRDMFEERLNFVLESDSGAIKGVRLINELSKMKARHYLNSIDKFF